VKRLSKGRKRLRIGFDFDGTLTKVPPIFCMINRLINSSKTPKFIYRPYWELIIKIPIFLDLKRLETLVKNAKDYDYYLITGRRGSAQMIEDLLFRYDLDKYFKEIVSPKACSKISTQLFKEKVCKAFEIDYYFEDNYYTIYYLREKGIKAIKI